MIHRILDESAPASATKKSKKFPSPDSIETVLVPAALKETKEWVTLLVCMPGVQRSNIRILLHKGTICIEAYRNVSANNNNISLIKRQRIKRRFGVRTAQVDMTKFTAFLCDDGILILRAPKIGCGVCAECMARDTSVPTVVLPVSTNSLHVIEAS